jgi:hypothetical protein
VAAQLGDLLDQARGQCFVGRQAELCAFDDAVAGRSPRRVLIVHGPGGIGKTTLVQEMRRRAPGAILLNGRQIDPSPEGFRAALTGPPRVLLVDSYEQLAPIDGWLRQEFVPSLGAPRRSSSWPVANRGPARGGPTRAGAGSSRSIGSTISTRRTALPGATRDKLLAAIAA